MPSKMFLQRARPGYLDRLVKPVKSKLLVRTGMLTKYYFGSLRPRSWGTIPGNPFIIFRPRFPTLSGSLFLAPFEAVPRNIKFPPRPLSTVLGRVPPPPHHHLPPSLATDVMVVSWRHAVTWVPVALAIGRQPAIDKKSI